MGKRVHQGIKRKRKKRGSGLKGIKSTYAPADESKENNAPFPFTREEFRIAYRKALAIERAWYANYASNRGRNLDDMVATTWAIVEPFYTAEAAYNRLHPHARIIQTIAG